MEENAVWRTKMKFVVEFIDAFIEPFTFILGPIAIMILVAVCLMKYQSDKKKKENKVNDCPDIPYPTTSEILPNPNINNDSTQIIVDKKDNNK